MSTDKCFCLGGGKLGTEWVQVYAPSHRSLIECLCAGGSNTDRNRGSLRWSSDGHSGQDISSVRTVRGRLNTRRTQPYASLFSEKRKSACLWCLILRCASKGLLLLFGTLCLCCFRAAVRIRLRCIRHSTSHSAVVGNDSGSTHQENDKSDDKNCSEYAAAEVHRKSPLLLPKRIEASRQPISRGATAHNLTMPQIASDGVSRSREHNRPADTATSRLSVSSSALDGSLAMSKR